METGRCPHCQHGPIRLDKEICPRCKLRGTPVIAKPRRGRSRVAMLAIGAISAVTVLLAACFYGLAS